MKPPTRKGIPGPARAMAMKVAASRVGRRKSASKGSRTMAAMKSARKRIY